MENVPWKEIAPSSLTFRIHAAMPFPTKSPTAERKKERKERKKYTGWKMENTNRVLLRVCETN